MVKNYSISQKWSINFTGRVAWLYYIQLTLGPSCDLTCLDIHMVWCTVYLFLNGFLIRAVSILNAAYRPIPLQDPLAKRSIIFFSILASTGLVEFILQSTSSARLCLSVAILPGWTTCLLFVITELNGLCIHVFRPYQID